MLNNVNRSSGLSVSTAEVRRGWDTEGMNGTAALRRSVGGGGGGVAGQVGGSPGDILPVTTLVVYKDDAGYGMKVSGDNPVYVQSVKEGTFKDQLCAHIKFYILDLN